MRAFSAALDDTFSLVFGKETLTYAGLAAALVVELWISSFGKPMVNVEVILGFVGICSLLALPVSPGVTVCCIVGKDD